MDGWDFKNYVLGTMFYRYISEDLTNYINQGEREAAWRFFFSVDALIAFILFMVLTYLYRNKP